MSTLNYSFLTPLSISWFKYTLVNYTLSAESYLQSNLINASINTFPSSDFDGNVYRRTKTSQISPVCALNLLILSSLNSLSQTEVFSTPKSCPHFKVAAIALEASPTVRLILARHDSLPLLLQLWNNVSFSSSIRFGERTQRTCYAKRLYLFLTEPKTIYTTHSFYSKAARVNYHPGIDKSLPRFWTIMKGR